jgi:flagellar protein FliO/FliZ
MSPYASYVVQTFVTLLAVCGVAFVVLYGARKLGIGRASGPVELVGQLPLDARRSIYLVKVGPQVLVVGVSEAGFAKLGELSAKDVPTSNVAEGAPFSDILARALGRKNGASSVKAPASEPPKEPGARAESEDA